MGLVGQEFKVDQVSNTISNTFIDQKTNLELTLNYY